MLITVLIFYCKIALINRFKLYLIKILTVTSKRKQKQLRIYIMSAMYCRIYPVNVTWPVVIIMTTGSRSTVMHWSFDNAQRHVTMFRPVSKAARSRSCDSVVWPTMSCFADWSKCRHVTFTIIECVGGQWCDTVISELKLKFALQLIRMQMQYATAQPGKQSRTNATPFA